VPQTLRQTENSWREFASKGLEIHRQNIDRAKQMRRDVAKMTWLSPDEARAQADYWTQVIAQEEAICKELESSPNAAPGRSPVALRFHMTATGPAGQSRSDAELLVQFAP